MEEIKDIMKSEVSTEDSDFNFLSYWQIAARFIQIDANVHSYHNQLKCMACSQTFSTRWDLGTHLKTVHYLKKEEDEETSEPTLVENRLLGEVFDLS